MSDFGGEDAGQMLRAYDLQTGEERWQRRLAQHHDFFPPVIERDRWRLVRLGVDDERLESIELVGVPNLRATPIVVDGTVVIPTNRSLQAFGAE